MLFLDLESDPLEKSGLRFLAQFAETGGVRAEALSEKMKDRFETHVMISVMSFPVLPSRCPLGSQ
jgi:hypothetical protein